jgi:hypothetical protein
VHFTFWSCKKTIDLVANGRKHFTIWPSHGLSQLVNVSSNPFRRLAFFRTLSFLSSLFPCSLFLPSLLRVKQSITPESRSFAHQLYLLGRVQNMLHTVLTPITMQLQIFDFSRQMADTIGPKTLTMRLIPPRTIMVLYS